MTGDCVAVASNVPFFKVTSAFLSSTFIRFLPSIVLLSNVYPLPLIVKLQPAATVIKVCGIVVSTFPFKFIITLPDAITYNQPLYVPPGRSYSPFAVTCTPTFSGLSICGTIFGVSPSANALRGKADSSIPTASNALSRRCPNFFMNNPFFFLSLPPMLPQCASGWHQYTASFPGFQEISFHILL